jgi:hypothetical protein
LNTDGEAGGRYASAARFLALDRSSGVYTGASTGLAAAMVLAGVSAWMYGLAIWPGRIWMTGLVVGGSIVVTNTVRGALRGRWASDVIAAVAIAASVVMDEPLAGS